MPSFSLDATTAALVLIDLVVHVHGAGKGYEVEFITLAGETVAVTTLLPDQVRPIAQGEIAHARTLQAA